MSKLSRKLRKLGHSAWIGVQESAAIQFGVSIEVDADESGDRYIRSPLITEVHHETRTVTGHGVAL